jgi:hypothetical protein
MNWQNATQCLFHIYNCSDFCDMDVQNENFERSFTYCPIPMSVKVNTFQNGLIKGKALLTFLLNSSSDYAIRKDQRRREEMDLTRTCRPLIYADDHLLKGNINAIKRNTALSDTSKKTNLRGRVNTETLMFRQQTI